jgi:protein-tyrosine-phosphatase
MLNIRVEANLRGPLELEETDLVEADIIIALDAKEHRTLIARRFAEWADEILYWHVPDLHLMEAEDALSRIETNVTHLAQELHNPTRLSEPGK